jgi:hypothetical protein
MSLKKQKQKKLLVEIDEELFKKIETKRKNFNCSKKAVVIDALERYFNINQGD